MQAYPHLPQPQRNKAFPSPLLNSVEQKLPVKVLATLLAEHKGRKAIGTFPLKWSRLAALAHCCGQDTFRIEEAAQVRANFWNKLLHWGTLGLGATLNDIKEGYEVQCTLLCSGQSGSSIQNILSTSISMDGRLASCYSAWWSSTSISRASLAGFCQFFEGFTSTGRYMVPWECFQGSHSITLISLWLSLKDFGCLYSFGCNIWMRMITLDVVIYILQEELDSNASNRPGGRVSGPSIELGIGRFGDGVAAIHTTAETSHEIEMIADSTTLVC